MRGKAAIVGVAAVLVLGGIGSAFRQPSTESPGSASLAQVATGSVKPTSTASRVLSTPSARSTATSTPKPTATPKPTPTPKPTTKPKPTPTPLPWHTKDEVAYVFTYSGSGAVVVGGYKKIGAECGYSSAGSGKTYVAVAVAYVAGTGGLFYSTSDWIGHDQDDRQYETEYAGICYDEGTLGVGNLDEGLNTGGIILFAVPRSTKHFYVDWRDTFSDSTETWRLW